MKPSPKNLGGLSVKEWARLVVILGAAVSFPVTFVCLAMATYANESPGALAWWSIGAGLLFATIYRASLEDEA